MFTIQTSDLVNTMTAAKIMKPDILYCNQAHIYSTDFNFTHIKTIERASAFNFELMFDFNAANAFLKKLSQTDHLIIDRNIIIDPHDVSNYIPLINLLSFTKQKINELMSEIQTCSKLSVYSDLMSSDQEFVRCASAKTADGLQMYRKDNYFMALFSGLLPINKSDVVNLSIFDSTKFSFIARFTVIKKKVPVDIYVRYMKI